MPPAFEVLLLNTTIPQIQAAQAGDTYVVPRDIAINATAIISANSATDALRITQTGAGNAILVEDSANPDSTPFVVTAAGDVGVGVATPAYRLSVQGSPELLADLYSTSAGFNTVLQFRNDNSANGRFGYYNGNFRWSVDNGVTQNMSLTSSGNLGIGETNPGWKLQVNGAAGVQTSNANAAEFHVNNTSASARDWALVSTGSSWAGGGQTGYFNIYDNTAGAQRLTIDTSGNLGLGVTPSAWAAYKAVQIGRGSFVSDTSSSSTYGTIVSANWFYDGANKYIINGLASFYQQDAGQHRWWTAANNTSGAGASMSPSQAMTLDASGNLLVGTTTSANNLRVNQKLAIVTVGNDTYTGAAFTGYSGTTALAAPVLDFNRSRGTTDGSMTVVASGDKLAYIIGRGSDGTNFINAASITFEVDGTPGTNDMPGRIVFLTTADGASGSTERARITSGGDFLVGIQTNNPAGTVAQIVNQWSGGAKWGASFDQTVSSATAYTHINFSTNGTTVGSINANNTSTTYSTSSDYRLKDNPQPLTGSGAFIDALQPKTWDWKSGGKGVGFIAHEVQAVSPGTVVGEKDAVDADGKPIMQAMEYGSAEFIANIIAELQSLRARVAQLEAK